MELQSVLLYTMLALCHGEPSTVRAVTRPKPIAAEDSNVSRPMSSPPVFPSGRLRAMFALAKEAAAQLNDLTSEVIKEEVGTFLRTDYGDGCLDAGCCMGIRKQVRFNSDCPSWGWLKWSFNGPMLVVHRPFLHSCLECEHGDEDCSIISSACRGKHSQFWHLNGTLGLKNSRGENLFAIVNDLHPGRCVTVDEASSNLYLRRCGHPERTQLFYITKNWIHDSTGDH